MGGIYLAASYARKDEMRGVRDVLETAGFKVTSRWIDQEGEYEKGDIPPDRYSENPEVGIEFAERDLVDIAESDAFIMFTGDELSSGGRHTEYGIALMYNMKAIIIVGPRENVFHCHPSVMQFPSWRQFCHHMWSGLAIVKAESVLKGPAKAIKTKNVARCISCKGMAISRNGGAAILHHKDDCPNKEIELS